MFVPTTKSSCVMHHVTKQQYNPRGDDNYWDEDSIPEVIGAITPLIPTFFPKLQRGDLIRVDYFGDYRNDGVLIYDGVKIINLEEEKDDYGHVPKQFQVISEFPINYWKDLVDHNYIVWFDVESYKQEILNNVLCVPASDVPCFADCDKSDIRFIKSVIVYTTFHVGDKVYYIVLQDAEDTMIGEEAIGVFKEEMNSVVAFDCQSSALNFTVPSRDDVLYYVVYQEVEESECVRRLTVVSV